MGIVINLPRRAENPKARPPVLDDHWTDAWRPGLVRILAAQCEKAGKEE